MKIASSTFAGHIYNSTLQSHLPGNWHVTAITQGWRPESEFELSRVAPDVWIARHPLVFYGFKMVTCMTIVRLGSGKLWVHSPVPLGQALGSAIDALGAVEYIVAPNRLHHLYAIDCASRYPLARLYVAPDLTAKNPAFANFPVIPTGSASPWIEDIDSVFVDGNAELNETVFLHRASGTLIITDLAVFLGPWDSLGIRLYARINGCYNRLGLSFLLKKFFRNRDAAHASIQRIAGWPFERIVLAHGPVIENHAHEAFDAAFEWLQ